MTRISPVTETRNNERRETNHVALNNLSNGEYLEFRALFLIQVKHQ